MECSILILTRSETFQSAPSKVQLWYVRGDITHPPRRIPKGDQGRDTGLPVPTLPVSYSPPSTTTLTHESCWAPAL